MRLSRSDAYSGQVLAQVLVLVALIAPVSYVWLVADWERVLEEAPAVLSVLVP